MKTLIKVTLIIFVAFVTYGCDLEDTSNLSDVITEDVALDPCTGDKADELGCITNDPTDTLTEPYDAIEETDDPPEELTFKEGDYCTNYKCILILDDDGTGWNCGKGGTPPLLFENYPADWIPDTCGFQSPNSQ